jgi:hypothetical protein
LCLAAAGWSGVSASADTTTTEGSTTTTFCVGGPSTDQLVVSPYSVVASQDVTISGEQIDDGTTVIPGECPQPTPYTGPISLYLSKGYINPGSVGTFRLGVAHATKGAFSASVTVPASMSIRGSANIGYASPDHDIAQTGITVLDPVPTTAPPPTTAAPRPVTAQPALTG